MEQTREYATAANYYLTQFYQLAKDRGLDADGMLQRLGINKAILDAPQMRVDTTRLALVVQYIWDQLQDEGLAVSYAPIPRGSFNMMGKLAIHEPTLGRALKVAGRFYGMVTRAYHIEINNTAGITELRFVEPGETRDKHHLFAEITLMAWHRFSSWLIAENLPLKDVFFNFPVPPQVAEYSYLFPGRHNFEAGFLGFTFPSRYLDESIVQNAASLRNFMRRCPADLFRQPQVDFSLSSEVLLILKRRIAEGLPSIEDTANQLNLTKRSLIRKLKDEGTSYQKLKDLVRRDRAVWLLSTHSLSVGEVAEKVGFSDSAVFSRAFKSWTGISPRSFRGDPHAKDISKTG